MTREEQIQRESEVYAWTANQFDIKLAFIKGAEWADANPQFSKEEFIEKACDWLRKHSSAGDEVATIQFNSLEEMIESLKNYMEQ